MGLVMPASPVSSHLPFSNFKVKTICVPSLASRSRSCEVLERPPREAEIVASRSWTDALLAVWLRVFIIKLDHFIESVLYATAISLRISSLGCEPVAYRLFSVAESPLHAALK